MVAELGWRNVQHVAKNASTEHAVGVADTACDDLGGVSGVMEVEDMRCQP
jgi:hypothetical protein